jgi:hypothetical protein
VTRCLDSQLPFPWGSGLASAVMLPGEGIDAEAKMGRFDEWPAEDRRDHDQCGGPTMILPLAPELSSTRVGSRRRQLSSFTSYIPALCALIAGADIQAQQAPAAEAAAIASAPVIDGRLDDSMWAQAEILTGFVQSRPRADRSPSAPRSGWPTTVRHST